MRVPLLLVAAAGLAVWAVHSGRITLPPQWNPWAPLDVAAPPDWLTRYKLERTVADPALCRVALQGTALTHTEVEDNPTEDGCGRSDAVRVNDPRFAPGFTLTCGAALSLAMWEHHALQPAAQRLFSEPVARVEHVGSYACRNVRGTACEGERRSQHALANAFDVVGFRLQSGARVSVLRDWPGEGPQAAFLREVSEGACRFFKGALGPDYNAAHRDHFHLDRGPYRICR